LKKFFGLKKAAARKTEPLPLAFNRHRVYILPTAHGLLFLIILFAMLLGSINYNNNLGFLLVFLLGSITLVSMIHTYRNLLGMEVLSVSVEPVFAGRTALFRFLVRSESGHRRAIGFVMEKNEPVIENISAQTDETVTVKIPTRYRGILRPGRLIVWTRYPLGLFRAWTVVLPDISCVVYPRPLAGSFQSSGGHVGDESDVNSIKDGVDDFFGLKPYQPGDPMGKISWKSFSRGLGVFVKEFAGNSGASVMLDYDALGDANREHKLSRLADMVLKAHNMNVEYGLLLPGRTIAPDKGERHRHACLKALALFDLSK
jgi:uncharacterized protein (DUF58 family)